ncbi:MAG: hypothetical protein ACRDXX_18995 [Stackebrandtia sp.]
MTTHTAARRSSAFWGNLAATPTRRVAGDGTVLLRLRLSRLDTAALARGVSEPDATRLLDLTVVGALAELDHGLVDLGDRVHVAAGRMARPSRPGVPVVVADADNVAFPTLT